MNAYAVAEHVMALILSWYKNIPYLDHFLKDRGEADQLDYTGAELYGKTIGIIGLGHVGRIVAEYCNAFHMTVLGYSHKLIEMCSVEQVVWTLFSETVTSSVCMSHLRTARATWLMPRLFRK